MKGFITVTRRAGHCPEETIAIDDISSIKDFDNGWSVGGLVVIRSTGEHIETREQRAEIVRLVEEAAP